MPPTKSSAPQPISRTEAIRQELLNEDQLYHRLLLCDPDLVIGPDTSEELTGGDSNSRSGDAYRQILLRIVRGDYPGGTALNTTQLARELGLSRTPLREALAALASDGIIEQKKNLRAIVRPGAENWLVQVHELRILLEPPAAAHAALTIPDATLDWLAQLAVMAAPDDEGDSINWLALARQYDYALHLAIAEYSGNLPLRESLRKCWSYKRISYEVGRDKPASLEQGYKEHLSILAALRARSPDTAHAAMLHHLHSAAHTRPAERII